MTGLSLVLVLAGIKTVSDLIAFTIHSLSFHPEYQSKIRKEVHEALTTHGVSELNFEIVRDLSFTTQCLFEATRLYPLEPFLWRQCSEDFQIPGTNYILRKGDRVALPLYSISRDEQLFSNPHSFNPERFKSKSADLTNPGTLLNFGLGPRKCPGYQQGLLMAAAIVASLMYKYEINPRSHLKLMDASDFHPNRIMSTPRTDILVDLVRCKKFDV